MKFDEEYDPHLPEGMVPAVDVGAAFLGGVQLPTMTSNNPNLNVHSGIGHIFNYNPNTNIFNLNAQKLEDTTRIKIAAALQGRHVPQAVYDAQIGAGCMEGTRVKLLSDIESWIKNPEAQSIFWLTGGAGMGKSAITKTVCERAHADSEIILGGSFFCSRSAGSFAQRDVRSVVPTLAQLLARQSADFSQLLAQELSRDPDVLHKHIDAQIKSLLYNPLLSLKESRIPVLFVIDALDECGGQLTVDGTSDDDESHRIVSDMLEALVGLSRSGVSLPVKFFVTSRPETHIRDTSVSDTAFSKVLRLHTVDKEQMMADIRLYVSTRLSSTTQLRAQFTSNDIEMLVHLCDGLFIVATTALGHALGAGIDGATERFNTLLNAARDGLSTSAAAPLDRMYSAILAYSKELDQLETDKLQDLLHLLRALLSTRMTLSVTGLADLLGISRNRVRAKLSRIHAVVHVPEDDIETGLRILHASFGDYLFERAPSDMRIAKLSGQICLAEACLRVMETKLHFNISQSRTSYESNYQTRPGGLTLALEYACLHWIYHVSCIPTGSAGDGSSSHFTSWARRIFRPLRLSGIEEKINAIFRPRFLFWLEVMSMLNQVRRAAAMLMLAATIVRAEDLSRFFRDANSFVASSHDAIECSAPHIYLSALPFASKDSLVYKAFAPLFTGLVSVDVFGIEHHGGNLIMTLTGHEGGVNSVTYSPDGFLIGSCSMDGTVRVWDMHTGEEAISPLRSNDGSVWSIAFASEGRSMASGTEAGVVCIWRLLAGYTTPQRLSGHNDVITSVAWSSDGSLIASASRDRTLRLWSAETGELIVVLHGHTQAVNTVTFSPDGLTLASGSDDETIRLWQSATGSPIGQSVCVDFDAIRGICFSPDGKIIAGSSRKGVRLWNPLNAKEITTSRSCYGVVTCVQFSADGQSLVFAESKYVRLWNLLQNPAKASLIGLGSHADKVCTVAFSPDSSCIASASEDRTIRIWNIGESHSEAQGPNGHEDKVNSVAVSSDGSFLVSGSWDRSVRVWHAGTGSPKFSPLEGHVDCVSCVAVSSDLSLIASASYDHTVRLWDAQTGKMVGKPLKKHTDWVRAVTFSPSSLWLASGSRDRFVCIWNVAKKRLSTFGPLICRGGVYTVAFSPGGRLIAAGSFGGFIYLWEAETGQRTGEPLRADDESVCSIAFSPDGMHVVSAGTTRVGRVWHIATGQQKFILDGHTDLVCSVTYSADGRFIGTGSSDSTVRIWDAATGTSVTAFHGHAGTINAVSFTPNSDSIVSCSRDNSIRVFSLSAAGFPPPNSVAHPLAALYTATNQNGWLVGPLGELLLWVPAAYRTYLPEKFCALRIQKQSVVVTVSGTGWIRGENWTSCWRDSASSSDYRRV